MHKNNFDFLRLIFAFFVLLTHSYILSGNTGGDFLIHFTSGQYQFSMIGVNGFFVISGYLVMQSLMRSKSIIDYLMKRILRIYPGLIVVLILTVGVCYFFYQGGGYFSNASTRSYIPNNLYLYTLQYPIQGIFENNPYKSAINGCLWTIPYEVTFYLLLACLFFFRENRKILLPITGIVYCFIIILRFFFYDRVSAYGMVFPALTADEIILLSSFFLAGALLAQVRIENYKYKVDLFVVACIFFLLTLIYNQCTNIQYIAFPLIVVIFGCSSTPFINSIGDKIGDLSYGIYIYGFVVQQSLMYLHPFSQPLLLLTSTCVTLIFAYLSWHLIEKRALKLKKKLL